MKRFKSFALILSTVFFVSTFSGCGIYGYVPQQQVVVTRYENPSWGPTYYQGVRYYYLPDIEAYYDLSNRQFVYLSNGRWYDSPECPTIYAGFDLDNCFAIALDVNVYQPWMHHQYYVSHYPRYYYRDYYDHSNIPYVRGFNENSKSAIYWPENQRHRARSWDSEGLKSNRQFKYTTEDRKQQNNWNGKGNSNPSSDDRGRNSQQNNWNGNNNNRSSNANTYPSQNDKSRNDNSNKSAGNDNSRNQPQNGGNKSNPTIIPSVRENNVTPQPQNTGNNSTPTRSAGTEAGSRQPQTGNNDAARTTRSTNYYGRTIGQPVKVEKQMRQETRTPSTDTKSSRSAGTRNEQDSQERK